ncbi:MAG: hypothetical protein ACXABY_34015 [Candidatus Thorarchaeota archaeon]|jgi:hypothetical protein
MFEIWIAHIQHKFGSEFFAALTEELLYDEIIKYCREWIPDHATWKYDFNLAAETNIKQAVTMYFENTDDGLDIGYTELVVPTIGGIA